MTDQTATASRPSVEDRAEGNERVFVRRFVFRDDVPRWRMHFYNRDGRRVFDMRENEPMPPLGAWETCALSVDDVMRLGGDDYANHNQEEK